jgi:hypothetical protein
VVCNFRGDAVVLELALEDFLVDCSKLVRENNIIGKALDIPRLSSTIKTLSSLFCGLAFEATPSLLGTVAKSLILGAILGSPGSSARPLSFAFDTLRDIDDEGSTSRVSCGSLLRRHLT